MVEEITDANFDEKTGQTGLVVVDFHATWCGPCKMYGPIFEQVAGENTDVKFYKMDNDANQKGKDLGVMGVPTTIFFKGGAEVDRQAGLMDAVTLKSKVDSLKVTNVNTGKPLNTSTP
jgi:thioredoxin 1|tara:strand:- start:2348 stop:2701 length:354 start_codon:yes stop_codon:yes gene_type:complete